MSIKSFKYIKLISLILLSVVAVIELLYITVLPYCLNSYLNSADFKKQFQIKTHSSLNYSLIKTSACPDFSLKLEVKGLKIKDNSGKNIIATDYLAVKSELIPLLFRHLVIDDISSENLQFNFRRAKDKNIYIGAYKLNKNISFKNGVNTDIKNSKIKKVGIVFYDELIDKSIMTYIETLNMSYKEGKYIKFDLDANILSDGKQKSKIFADISSELPINKGMVDRSFVLNASVTNLDLSDYSPYFSYFWDKNIKSAKGIINFSAKTKNRVLYSSAKIADLNIKMKNDFDSIKSNSLIKQESEIVLKNNLLDIKKQKIYSQNWAFDIKGLITEMDSNNPEMNLKISSANSDIYSLYWLLPSVKSDPQNAIYKFKKYGAWGKLKADINIKGKVKKPEIYGQAVLSDVYIVKNDPLVPHCKVFLRFLKDNVKVYTKIFAGYGQYILVDGIAQMKVYGKGDFHITSSENVELSLADYMLIPVHDVVGFDLGPVPFMKLKGRANIDIYTKGTVKDGSVNGKFNFHDITASLKGLNTKLEHTTGSLDFNGKNIQFYTKKAFVKQSRIKIDGKSSLSGNIDFDIFSDCFGIDEFLNILNTSEMLAAYKDMIEPVEVAQGKIKVKIKIKGQIDNFSNILKNDKVVFAGKVDFKDNKIKLKAAPLFLNKIKGYIEFKDENFKTALNAFIGTSPISFKGQKNGLYTNFRAFANAIKTDELIAVILDFDKENTLKTPKTHSLITFDAQYKSFNKKFDYSKIKAQGYFKPLSKSSDFAILNGKFMLSHGNLRLNGFNAKFYDSKILLNTNIDNIFSSNPIVNGHVSVSDFDLKNLNYLKNAQFLPRYLKKLLNAYENYEGHADVSVDVTDNSIKGKIDLKNIKFNHIYYKTPVAIDSGNVYINNNKITLHSIVAQVDNTPLFMNIVVKDFNQIPKISGYFTTKFTEKFVNKYINSFLTYPLKPKGDITLTADINGSLQNINIKPKFKFAQNSDLYYMGADLGDDDDVREVVGDFVLNNRKTLFIRKFEYIRYMTSQNYVSYPMVVLTANGVVDILDKHKFYLRNFNVKTLNNANVKMFNIIFKKSVLKSGMFNCDLNIKGDLNRPIVLGSANMENLNMPLFDTVLNNMHISFGKDDISLNADGSLYSSDFKISMIMKNDFGAPYVIKNLNINSGKLNFDKMLDSLNDVPTPDVNADLAQSSSQKNGFDISKLVIEKGQMKAKDFVVKDLPAQNYDSEFSLDNMVLKLNKMSFDITTGKMIGTATYDFTKGKIRANITSLNVDSNKIASSLFEFKNQIYGRANGNITVITSGKTQQERLKNLFGYVYFEVGDGRMPELGSVEYLLKASNFIKSGITGVSLNNLIDLIAPVKTGYFHSIKGNFVLKNGVAQNIAIFSKGDNLNLYINGEYDILQQYANMRVYGRLTKRANNILGAVGNVNFNSLLNSIPGIKLDKGNNMLIIKDINKIPGVELSDQKYRIFTVKIDGKIDENKYVKNFRWIE